ncbi:MAG: hypothetical protein JWP35_2940 [Caulobacter sp.]|nr:hypothetical protein [Caulobacter sp.]
MESLATIEYEWLALVAGLALLEGGRHERPVALAVCLYCALFGVVMGPDWTVIQTRVAAAALQAPLLALAIWMARRHRPAWLLTLIVLEIVMIGLWTETALAGRADMGDFPPLLALDSGVKWACLAWALARRWLTPPASPPLSPQADIDIYEAAVARWPGSLRAGASA